MMKSFFKKLAFVMALAMVVSLAAPAATTASAASNLKIAYQNGSAISEVNIAKVGGTEDLKFTGAPSNWKTLGVKWSSNNEAVATVDAAGVVTAMGAGTAVIAVQVGADQATVKVNVVDLPVYTATMGTTDNRNMTELTLDKVGAEFDLAFFGIKDYDKNRYNCNWYSVDENVATVDQKGLVKATGEGKTVISLGVYNVVTGKKHVVDSCTVVVGAAEPTKAPVNKDAFTVAQKDTDKFVLTFEEAKTVDQIKENLTVSVEIGEQDFPISFENVTVNGKEAIVVTYANFEDGEVYTLAYGEETVEHKIVLGEIANVGVKYYTGKNPENTFAYVTEEEENDYVTLIPVLFDKYGNDITAKYDLNNFSFSYEVSGNVSPVCVYNDTFAFDAAGVATVNVIAAWVTDGGDYKEVTGKTSFQVLKRGSIGLTLVKSGILDTDAEASTDDINDKARVEDDMFVYFQSPKTSFQVDPNSKLWSDAKTSVMYKTDDTRDLVYTAVLKDNRGNVITTNDVANGYIESYKFGSFIYESTNSEVLTVADGTGEVEINNTGRANILVYFLPADGTDTKKLVASTMITVTPETYPVSYKMTTALDTKAAHVLDEDLNDGTFKVQFLDQNGQPYRNDELVNLIKVEARDSKNTVGIMADPVWEGWSKNYTFKIDASAFVADLGDNNSKTYSYKLTVEESDLTEKIKTPYAVFSFVVKNTADECAKIADFINNGYVAPNYKFNIGFGGNQTVDLAVKNVVDYAAVDGGPALQKHTWWSTQVNVKYLSTGNLEIANVPLDKIVNINAGAKKLTTGDVGYVYYKVNAPSRVMVAGESVANDAFENRNRAGVVDFYFNKTTAATAESQSDLYLEDANGTKFVPQMNTDKSALSWAEENSFYIVEGASTKSVYSIANAGTDGNPWTRPLDALEVGTTYYIDGDRELTCKQDTIPAKPATFKYAAAGNYSVSFYTTRKDDTVFNNIATRTLTMKNTQSEVKYVGLNPEYNGVTETYDYIDESNLVNVVREQLMFTYEDLFIGEYYDKFDGYGMNVTLSANQPKVHYANDGKSVTVAALYFDVTLDDGNDNTDYKYTSVVSVGARIKVK